MARAITSAFHTLSTHTGIYMEWRPHVTVATVVEHEGKYLLIEETSNKGLVFNQPAGHLDPNETLQQAAVRETLEESGWEIELQGVIGAALYTSPHNQVTYHRTTFYAKALSYDPERPLDQGIVRAVWMTYEEMCANAAKMRSELVISSVQQYRNGHRYPLEIIYS